MKAELLTKPFSPQEMKVVQGSSEPCIDPAALIARLNDLADFAWSFEIMSHELTEKEAVVLGKLTIAGISKMAFGSSPLRDGGSVALKAAASDCLTRAAALFGLGHAAVNHNNPHGTNGNGTTPTRGGPPEPIDRITARQLAAIHALCRKRNMPLGELADMLQSRMGKTAPQFLNKKEASAVLDELTDLAPR